MLKYSRVIECSQYINEGTPVWPGNQALNRCLFKTFAEHGYELNTISLGTGTGTHIDAPGHMIKEGRKIDQLSPEELVSPGVLLNVEHKCIENPDYELSVNDLFEWENQYGRIPDKALVCMRTG